MKVGGVFTPERPPKPEWVERQGHLNTPVGRRWVWTARPKAEKRASSTCEHQASVKRTAPKPPVHRDTRGPGEQKWKSKWKREASAVVGYIASTQTAASRGLPCTPLLVWREV